MDTAFFSLLAATTAKITAPATEWKALLKLLPPCEEVLPLFKKIAGSARFFTSGRLLTGYRGARLLVASCAAHRDVGGTCVFNVGQRAALTFVISAHPKEFTTPQKKIVPAVLLNAEEICGPVTAMLYDLAVKSDMDRARDIGLEAFISARQLSDDINEFYCWDE